MPGAANATRLLVVDDDPVLGMLLTETLHDAGYTVTTRGHGGGLLAVLVREQPAAVLLDVMMPDITGLEVLRQMRKAGDPTPVILMSAHLHDPPFLAALGAQAFLAKPFAQLTDVTDTVARVLAERTLR